MKLSRKIRGYETRHDVLKKLDRTISTLHCWDQPQPNPNKFRDFWRSRGKSRRSASTSSSRPCPRSAKSTTRWDKQAVWALRTFRTNHHEQVDGCGNPSYRRPSHDRQLFVFASNAAAADPLSRPPPLSPPPPFGFVLTTPERSVPS